MGALLTAALLTFFATPAAVACETLASLKLADATITAAESHPAGSVKSPQASGLPGFCRIAATVRPTGDSDIKIEMWLPLEGWNGKLDAVGNGGWGGTMPYGAMAAALSGRVDAVLLTGGVAKSHMFTGMVAGMTSFIAPVRVYPGEFEMEALADHASAVLAGEEEVLEYE